MHGTHQRPFLQQILTIIQYYLLLTVFVPTATAAFNESHPFQTFSHSIPATTTAVNGWGYILSVIRMLRPYWFSTADCLLNNNTSRVAVAAVGILLSFLALTHKKVQLQRLSTTIMMALRWWYPFVMKFIVVLEWDESEMAQAIYVPVVLALLGFLWWIYGIWVAINSFWLSLDSPHPWDKPRVALGRTTPDSIEWFQTDAYAQNWTMPARFRRTGKGRRTSPKDKYITTGCSNGITSQFVGILLISVCEVILPAAVQARDMFYSPPERDKSLIEV